jgi:Dolichyl-phosphate-mannose-protein mannosyltransferase
MSRAGVLAGSRADADYSIVGWQIALLLVIAFALRIEFVTEPLVDPFSWREASTAMMADNLPRNGWNPLWPEVSWTGDMPGYQGRELQLLTIFSAILNEIFGWSDWSGRLVASIFGTLTTYSLYRLISIVSDRTQGLISALFYAFLPGAILIDSSYLPDPGMLAIAVTALWFLAEGISASGARARLWYALSAIAGTVAILAKLPALTALVPACYLVWSSAKPESRVRAMTILAGTLILCSIPVFGYYRWAIYLGTHYPPFHIAGHGWLWDEGVALFWNNNFYIEDFYNHITHWLWGPVFIVLAPLGIVSNRKGRSGTNENIAPWFLEFWLLGCMLFYLAASLELKYNSWNLHVFSPVIAALSARGCTALTVSDSIAFMRARILVLLLLAFVLGRQHVHERMISDREGDYLMGMHMRILSEPGDLVVVSGNETGAPIAIYYSRRRGWIFPTPEMSPNFTLFSEDGEQAILALRTLASRGGRWFGINKKAHDQSLPSKHFMDHYRILLEYLSEHARLAGETDTHIIYDISSLAQ